MKIGFIGTGNMGTAMIEGYVKAAKAPEIFVFDADETKSRALRDKLGVAVCKDSRETVQKSDVIVIAVKPHIYETVMKDIKSSLDNQKVVVSIAAGITIEKMQSVLGKTCKIVRTMPNTPCMAGEGMIAVTPNANITQADLEAVMQVLSYSGMAEVVPENLMDAVVGISGSSPAYVYMFIEALADGGVANGLPRDQAYRFAAQAVLGSAKMVMETGKHPGVLKDAVCSPGGATIEAVKSLEQNNFRYAVMSAVQSVVDKTREMTKENA